MLDVSQDIGMLLKYPFVFPGGTFSICCSMDHRVPCREYSVYLLHI